MTRRSGRRVCRISAAQPFTSHSRFSCNPCGTRRSLTPAGCSCCIARCCGCSPIGCAPSRLLRITRHSPRRRSRGRCMSLDSRARARPCYTICSHAIRRRVGCAFGKASIRRRHRNRWRMIPALPRWRNGRLVSRRSPRDWQPPTNWPRAGRRNVSGSSNIPSTISSSSYAPMCPPTRAGWPSTRRMSTFINITVANSNCLAPIAVAIIGCSRRHGIYPVWPVCSPSFPRRASCKPIVIPPPCCPRSAVCVRSCAERPVMPWTNPPSALIGTRG